MLIVPLDAANVSLSQVGGKGLNLTHLVRAGFPVPGGFLVTTAAYHAYVAANDLAPLIQAALATLTTDDPAALKQASKKIRTAFHAGEIPPALKTTLATAYSQMAPPDADPPVAVRSSATAEDLPDMSFAGQQDTFLNIIGLESLLTHVMACWSSLWTARAIGYRTRNQVPHDDVALAVVIQQMAPSTAAGVLFTANPLNGNRTETVIDATLGLGEALVSGQVEPDHYVVKADTGEIRHKTLGAKALVIQGQAAGGTSTVTADAAQQQAIPDAVIVELAALGQQVAQLFGTPQDIEWSWTEGHLSLLQARPITSLYPLPAGLPADPLQVTMSFAAIQGVLDPLTPLGRELWQSAFINGGRLFGIQEPADWAAYVAGERLYINITRLMQHRFGQKLLRTALPAVEPGIVQGLDTLWDDPRLQVKAGWFKWQSLGRLVRFFAPFFGRMVVAYRRPDAHRDRILQRLDDCLARFEAETQKAASLQEQVTLLEKIVPMIFDVCLTDLLPTAGGGMSQLIMIQRLAKSVGQDAMALTRGLPHNVTTEMNLALWAAARRIKADERAFAHVTNTPAETLATQYQNNDLPPVAQEAVTEFLAQYGMRGIAEIDFGRSRWQEDPMPVLQSIQSYLQIEDEQLTPDVVFARSEQEARAFVEALVAALQQARGGWLKARVAKAAAYRVRALAGLRERPKFFIIQLLGIVRAEMLKSGERLVADGVLNEPQDLFFLTTAELKQLAAQPDEDWRGLVADRRDLYEREKLRRQIPRLLLSDGRVFYEGLGRIAEADGALVGSPVSSGVVEGRVHVIFDPHNAQLEPGEILVCPGTDPAWTPLFLAAAGLVMEVGGLMTHGSVVAREYGIPAVVGVHEATTRLQTGQLIQVDGSAGTIRILAEDETS